MNTQTQAPAAADTRLAQVCHAAVEQVMRACDDDLAVLPFFDVEPGSAAAASALGRLLCEHPVRLVSGCPLMALVAGTAPDPHWREAYPARSGSLYANLEFLSALYGSVHAPDAYSALELLRARAAEELDFDPA